jgi:AcrR family transcriptional regulator
MEKIPDRRVQRTRNMLLDAFLDLMIEKGYEAITVQDVIDRANIGRSTFYLHFTDKENLLSSSIGQLMEFIKEQSRIRIESSSDSGFRFGFSLAMLQHAQSHKRIYKAIVGKKGEAPVMWRMKEMLVGLVREQMPTPAPGNAIPKDLTVDFVIGTFMTVLSWWMDQNMPCSAMEADGIFHKFILEGLKT